MRKIWTTEENNIIITLRSQGVSYKQIQEVMPYRTLRAVAVQGAKICAKPASKLWSIAEEQKLIELRQQEVPYKEIAEILGRSYSAVKTKGSGLIVDSTKSRPMAKVSMEHRNQQSLSDLTCLELDYIENGQEFFRF